MSIDVIRLFRLRNGVFWEDQSLPKRWQSRPGDIIWTLTKLREHDAGDGPEWKIRINLREGKTPQAVDLNLERFLSRAEYHRTIREPVPFSDFDATRERAGESESGWAGASSGGWRRRRRAERSWEAIHSIPVA